MYCPHRAKLAEWLASKGKTLKRPAMKAGPSKTKVSAKPEPDLKPQPVCNPEPAPRVEAHEADSTAAHCADTQGAELTHSQTPAIMNTTLELLENSVADLSVVPQDRVDDVRKHASCCCFNNFTSYSDNSFSHL